MILHERRFFHHERYRGGWPLAGDSGRSDPTLLSDAHLIPLFPHRLNPFRDQLHPFRVGEMAG